MSGEGEVEGVLFSVDYSVEPPSALVLFDYGVEALRVMRDVLLYTSPSPRDRG